MDYITYEMFGAAGDGRTDDMPAIVSAHEHANKAGLPVRAKPGAVYYISPADATAVVQTSTDWTGAEFLIDDVNCENLKSPVFLVTSALAPIPFTLRTLEEGQSFIDNPTGQELYLLVFNAHHNDYIRRGLNQDNGSPRRDAFILGADGLLSSPVSLTFEEITEVRALPIDRDKLVLTGGEFTTIANQAESKYNYHARNIEIRRSNVEVSGITHLVTGELDHGAPYRGFISVLECARVDIHDCLFTAHKIYWTIGSANLPVAMGSYDINLNAAANVTISRCAQTTDIMDRAYWGLIGSNFCRDLTLEDCRFSRFDAHCGVHNCTLRRCTLGHQCLNAIGFGTFLVEDTEACGRALVTLRSDYGSTWRGDFTLRNCTWRPLGKDRSVFSAHNDGTHDFGYACFLPQRVMIDGLTVIENGEADPAAPLTIFNDYSDDPSIPADKRVFMPIPPVSVEAGSIATDRRIELCAAPALMPDTAFILH